VKTPLEQARSAHRETRTLAALDRRVIAAVRAPRVRAPRFASWWVPAATSPLVLLLWFVLHTPATRLGPVDMAMPPVVPVAVDPPVSRESWSAARQLPEPQSNHVTLWAPGETGIQSLLDETVSYGVFSGVQVSLRSDFATIDKRSEQHVVMLSGHLDWNIRYLETAVLTLEVLGVVYELAPGRFSLQVQPGQVQLDVHDGQVVVRSPRESARSVVAGQRVASRAVVALPPTVRWTRAALERRLEAYAKTGRHGDAAAFIRSVIPQVTGELRESLLVDLAAIYGQHLHDWDQACSTLSWAAREFPAGALAEGIVHLRDRYRCP
jgi:hypothetical protein